MTLPKNSHDRAAINRFERAVRDHEGIGGAHPIDRCTIEEEYIQAKAHLLQRFERKGT